MSNIDGSVGQAQAQLGVPAGVVSAPRPGGRGDEGGRAHEQHVPGARSPSEEGAQGRRSHPGQPAGSGATTIHGVPKRSVHMPKAVEKNVGMSSWVTVPPSASASNTRFASASSAAS